MWIFLPIMPQVLRCVLKDRDGILRSHHEVDGFWVQQTGPANVSVLETADVFYVANKVLVFNLEKVASVRVESRFENLAIGVYDV